MNCSVSDRAVVRNAFAVSAPFAPVKDRVTTGSFPAAIAACVSANVADRFVSAIVERFRSIVTGNSSGAPPAAATAAST